MNIILLIDDEEDLGFFIKSALELRGRYRVLYSTGGKSGIEYGGRRVKFVGCDFSDATFKGVEFRASRFIDCIFYGTSFSACDFRGVKAEGGVMPNASQFEKMDVPVWARLYL